MTELEEKNAIWRQISGANKLLEIYGYFPTLHDAIVKNIDVRFDARQVVFTVEYNDLVEKSPETTERRESTTTRFQICWREVQQANLKLYAGDLLGVSLRRKRNFIETRFRDHAFGFDGFIVARDVEVLNIEQIFEMEKQTSNSSITIQMTIEN